MGIISTYVENTWAKESEEYKMRDHLHIRGEHSPRIYFLGKFSGSSPHTWRTRQFVLTQTRSSRIISTYVENTRNTLHAHALSKDHLHIRGEHLGAWSYSATSIGSSPHTWRTLRSVLGF